MAWFKVDDRLWAHPKVINLPLTALGLWVKAGSYCAQFETDGALETHMVRTLGAQKRDADRLVSAGLWERTETGYVFHNWDEFQPTKAQKDAERQATKERVSKWRNGKRNGVTNGVSNGGGNGGCTDAPTRPDPTRELSKDSSTPQPPTGGKKYGPEFTAFWDVFPSERKRNKSGCQKLFTQAVKDGTPADTLIAAAAAYATDPNREPQYTVNPYTWLREERWESGPLPARANTANRSQAELWAETAATFHGQGLRAIEGGNRF